MTTRILLAEEHSLFRDALVHLLGELDESVDVVPAGTAREAVAAASYYQGLDLILLASPLAGAEGISIVPQLCDAAKGVPVVIISSGGRAEDVRRAMSAGAASFTPRTIGAHEFLFALHRVLAGEPYLPAYLLAAMTAEDHSPGLCGRDQVDNLTKRQRQVLLLLSKGLSNKDIAERLNLSEGTIKLHVSAIMRALGARNRTEAALAAGQYA